MPCSRHEYRNAVEEGARFLFQALPMALTGDAAGRLTGLRLVRTELGPEGPDGRRPFQAVTGSDFSLEADWVIPALGFDPQACPHTGDLKSLEVNSWGGLVVDDQQMTSVPGVFAGGDLVRGPSNVLHVVRDARRASLQIHAWLAARRAATSAG